jgi:hypothetical protein
VRSHGWSGNAPATDEKAIDRILDAADDIIAERGSSMRIADVARTWRGSSGMKACASFSPMYPRTACRLYDLTCSFLVELPGIEPAPEISLTCGNSGSNDAKRREST